MSPEHRPPSRPEAEAAPGPEPPPWDAFEEPEPEPEPTRRSVRLLVLAAIPWAVVAVLVFRTMGTDAAPAPAAPSDVPSPIAPALAETATGPADVPSAPGATDARNASTHAPAAVRFGVRVAPGPADVAAMAVLVARTWLGDVGPEPSVEVGAAEAPPVYVEHVAVEAVDIPTSDTAVATVVAIVLDTADDTYTSARVVRLAVPVALDRTGAHPAGDPWWLPVPDLTARPLAWTPVEDPELLTRAGAALEAAGYRDVSVIDLATSSTWPVRVTAEAVAPGSERTGEHVVWLRDHLGDLVVAGALPPAHRSPAHRSPVRSPVQRATTEEDRR